MPETWKRYGSAFAKKERERRNYRKCGGIIDVHHGCCSTCGKEREYLRT